MRALETCVAARRAARNLDSTAGPVVAAANARQTKKDANGLFCRRRINHGFGKFCCPGVPLALDTVNPLELLALERPIHCSAGQSPASPGLPIFEGRGFRRAGISVKGERARV